MSHTLSNPAQLHDPVPFGYSHVADVPSPGLVFVAGQYASDDTGQVSTEGFAEQVEKSFENLGIALASEGLDFSHVARLGTYVVDHDLAKLEALGTVLARIRGERPPAQTLLGVAGLALPGMLFEVDAVAVRP